MVPCGYGEMIDVSEVITDPDFVQDFTLYRSSGLFAVGGWQENAPVKFDMTGVVFPTTSKDLNMMPEGDRVTESLTFYAPYIDAYGVNWGDELPFQVTRTGEEQGTSDQIDYNGVRYRIQSVKDYSAYGYCKAIGVRMDGS
jgi:hypothetical protein